MSNNSLTDIFLDDNSDDIETNYHLNRVESGKKLKNLNFENQSENIDKCYICYDKTDVNYRCINCKYIFCKTCLHTLLKNEKYKNECIHCKVKKKNTWIENFDSTPIDRITEFKYLFNESNNNNNFFNFFDNMYGALFLVIIGYFPGIFTIYCILNYSDIINENKRDLDNFSIDVDIYLNQSISKMKDDNKTVIYALYASITSGFGIIFLLIIINSFILDYYLFKFLKRKLLDNMNIQNVRLINKALIILLIFYNTFVTSIGYLLLELITNFKKVDLNENSNYMFFLIKTYLSFLISKGVIVITYFLKKTNFN